MSGFTASWLRAREPHDHAVRSARLADRFAAHLGKTPRLLDLGTGTGSNIRYLAPRLGRNQRWIALDHDPSLIQVMADAFAASGFDTARHADRIVLDVTGDEAVVTPKCHDLRVLNEVLDEVDAITASALLDLASAAWLDDLAARISRPARPALFALSFDGRITILPDHPDDKEVQSRFIRHQTTDKGFGPALGPKAVRHFAMRLEERGRAVELETSDWVLDATQQALTWMFLDGIRTVLAETEGPSHEGWLEARLTALEAGRLRIVVGHRDLLVL